MAPVSLLSPLVPWSGLPWVSSRFTSMNLEAVRSRISAGPPPPHTMKIGAGSVQLAISLMQPFWSLEHLISRGPGPGERNMRTLLLPPPFLPSGETGIGNSSRTGRTVWKREWRGRGAPRRPEVRHWRGADPKGGRNASGPRSLSQSRGSN